MAILWGAAPVFSWWPFDDPLKKERLETELHPDSSGAWGRLAYVAWQKEMWSDVETAAKKAIKTSESVSDMQAGYRYLGHFYEHNGDSEMAKMCFARSGAKEKQVPVKESKEETMKRALASAVATPIPVPTMPPNLKPLPPLKLDPIKFTPPPPIPVFTATPPP